MKYLLLTFTILFGLSQVHAVEPGTFELSKTDNRYSLEAAEAPVSAILTELAKTWGKSIGVDEADASTVTLSLDNVTLEKLVSNVSDGYAMIFTYDEATSEYIVDRVVAAGSTDPVDLDTLDSNELDVKAVVKAIQEKARNIKRFSQSMTTSMDMMGTTMNINGKMWSDGDRMRMEMTVPPTGMQQVMVSDGETTYIHMPVMNMVQTIDNKRIEKELGPDYASMSGTQQPGNTDPFQGLDEESLSYSGAEMVDGEKMLLLEGELGGALKQAMGAAMPAPDTVSFWLSAEDGLPRKVIFYGDEGQEMMSQAFTDVAVNPELDDSLFTFDVPEDAQVMDITDMAINMHNAMKSGGGSGTKAK